jgi:hypothetical protein
MHLFRTIINIYLYTWQMPKNLNKLINMHIENKIKNHIKPMCHGDGTTPNKLEYLLNHSYDDYQFVTNHVMCESTFINISYLLLLTL